MVQETVGDCEKDSCVKIDLKYPQVEGNDPIAQKINHKIELQLFQKINRSEDSVNWGREKELNRFINEYYKIKRDFAHLHFNYEFTASAEVTAQSRQLVSIYITSYTYTGGAHPMTYREFINLNPEDGSKIEMQNFFSNFEGFKELVERRLRAENNVPEDAPWTKHFYSDRFTLPTEMGFTGQGLKLIYGLYEIQPYAAGFKELTIAYDTLVNYMDPELISGIQ